MDPRTDQPRPGTAVPSLPPPPPVVPVVQYDTLDAARERVDSGFDAVAVALAGRTTPDFAGIAQALLQLSDVEWRVLSPGATGDAHTRLVRWCDAQSTLAAAVADLAHDARENQFQRALLRRRAWQYADAFREALAWRRDQFGRVGTTAVR